MGARWDHLSEAALAGIQSLCFWAEIRKNEYPCKPQSYYMKVGCMGVFITWTCYPDEIGKY